MEWNAQRYIENASFVPKLGMPVLDLLNIQENETILDLGCGDGLLTTEILKKAGGVRVLAVDSSPEMVRYARSRGLLAVECDGEHLEELEQKLILLVRTEVEKATDGEHQRWIKGEIQGGFKGGFKVDAVFSNAALHWMKKPELVIKGVNRVLKGGEAKGRFVAEMGGFGNVAAVRTAIHSVLRQHGLDPISRDPWYFPRKEEYEQQLIDGGFQVVFMEIIHRPTELPGSIEKWLDAFATPFTAALEADLVMKLKQQLVEILQPILLDFKGIWIADYVRLRFVAVKIKDV